MADISICAGGSHVKIISKGVLVSCESSPASLTLFLSILYFQDLVRKSLLFLQLQRSREVRKNRGNIKKQLVNARERPQAVEPVPNKIT